MVNNFKKESITQCKACITVVNSPFFVEQIDSLFGKGMAKKIQKKAKKTLKRIEGIKNK